MIIFQSDLHKNGNGFPYVSGDDLRVDLPDNISAIMPCVCFLALESEQA